MFLNEFLNDTTEPNSAHSLPLVASNTTVESAGNCEATAVDFVCSFDN
jgi:hypothetical protein